jgi:hypothetical protein
LANVVNLKVAASGGKQNIALASFAKVATTTALNEAPPTIPFSLEGSPESNSKSPNETTHSSEDASIPSTQSTAGTSDPEIGECNSKLVDAVKALNVHDAMPSLVVNGAEGHNKDSTVASTSDSPDDPYQRTDSGSDFGTKPPSLDGKSITSGTTFALDEKESLRPDDSASVKAAEDDDTFSGRGSIVAGSRFGSEVAGRGYRYESHLDRRQMVLNQEQHKHGATTPHSGSSSQPGENGAKLQPMPGQDAHSLFYRQTPDEKLIEALESPKDRIFLLRIEQQVMEFVKSSK